jgi:hypothetical protein
VRYGYVPRQIATPLPARIPFKPKENPMVVTATQITPLVAIVAGILILIIPRLLNYIVALYLIFIGLVGLNQTHHWVHLGMDTHATHAVSVAQMLSWLHV